MKEVLLTLAVTLGGCVARFPIVDDAAHRAEGAALADLAVRAHGGIEAWRTLGGVRLHLHTDGPRYPRESDWLLDPARNRAVMRWQDDGHAMEARYDGRHAVIVKDGRCVGTDGSRAAMASRVVNVLFWFGVPWKFRDAGAVVRSVPPLRATVGAPPSERYYVSYTVGDTPKDWFLVWLDPATKRVARIDYVASELSRTRVLESRWERYADVGGLSFATHRMHQPRSLLLRPLARPFVEDVSDIAIQQPLEEAMFSPPEACVAVAAAAQVTVHPKVSVAVDEEAELTINRDRATVAAFAADPANIPRWFGADVWAVWDREAALGVGTALELRARFRGRELAYRWVVTEYEAGVILRLRAANGPAVLEASYEWTAIDPRRTQMLVRVRGTIAVARIAAPLVPGMLRRATRENLARLKAVLER